MGHYGGLIEWGVFSLRWSTSLVFLTVMVVVLLLALALFWRQKQLPPQSDVDAEVYENMDGQISSMLLQAGGSLTQDSINMMEKRGEVVRKWLASDYTYLVSLPDGAQMAAQ